MQMIRQQFEPRRTGLMARERRSSEQQKSFVLRTPVEVYGYHNFRATMKKYGFVCFARRQGKVVRVYVNQKPPPTEKAVQRPVLRKALVDLKGDDCLVLTTPVEAHYFAGQRHEFKRHGFHFHSKRNGVNVLVWKKE
jgi:hypothetical protein